MPFPFDPAGADAARLHERRTHRILPHTTKARGNHRRQRRRCRFETLQDRAMLSAASLAPNSIDETIVFATSEPLVLSGEGDYLDVAHDSAFELSEGSVAMTFVPDEVEDRRALFSKDADGYQNGGHLTAFVNDGRVEVRLQSTEKSIWLKSEEVLEPGESHHLAVTFGSDGFWLYVDGRLEGWRTSFGQGLEANMMSLAVGANTWGRSEEDPDWRWNFFDGTIADFTLYGTQFSRQEVAALAGVEPEEPLSEPTVIDGVLHGTDRGEWLRNTTHAHGGYGDDRILGTSADDRLDGGHGEDLLIGGEGNDVLVSRSDGREARLAQEYEPGEDDPYGEIDPVTRTIYPDQPIASDDMMIGGPGGDTFRFEVLVNAKINIILKHVRDDRTIDWHGVTGENRLVHDHWVDRLGDEVILDFNRAEGDKIEIVGHTVDVYKVVHRDHDGDGMLDSSVIYVQSNQGNAGAHNKDKLGTITVFGDLVMAGDYMVNAQPAYGIVETIDELDEAMAPKFGSPVVSDGTSRWLSPSMQLHEGELPEGAVFAVPGALPLSGERDDYVLVEHTDAMALNQGTVALTFAADDVNQHQALFSKDATGYQDGGHLTAFVNEGRIKVRLQTPEKDVWIHTNQVLTSAEEHHLAVTFGDGGFWVYVDGRLEGWKPWFDQDIALNTADLAIGANIWGRSGEEPDWASNFFAGTIADFTLYGTQFSRQEVAALAGVEPEEPLSEPTVIDGVLHGTDRGEWLRNTTHAHGGYGDDRILGTSADDRLDGGHGEDLLIGGEGNDVLVSRSDGREARLAQEYEPGEDDPYGEIDPITRTIYPDQPIASDDMMIGGPGGDTFRFEVLVNAKINIILKHVRDDRTIDWHGVTGENRLVHDHWVDRLGDEVIMDFNRAQGDKIEIVGHTVDVYKVVHRDHDGDGMLDSSVIYVQSNQGNAGAHNKDKLGTITVFGDLVMAGDYMVNAQPAYGIVETIDELDEAMAPKFGSPVVSDGTSRWLSPSMQLHEGELPEGAVFAVPGALPLSGERDDYVLVEHTDAMALDEGTVALTFAADDVNQHQALFSKDATGYQDGGHLTAFVNEGRIKVRLQTPEKSVWATTEPILVSGQTYDLAVSFGSEGLRIYVDGNLEAENTRIQQGIAMSTADLAIGANIWSRSQDKPDWAGDFLRGVISDFTIYRTQYGRASIARHSGAVHSSSVAAAVERVLGESEEGDWLDAAVAGRLEATRD